MFARVWNSLLSNVQYVWILVQMTLSTTKTFYFLIAVGMFFHWKKKWNKHWLIHVHRFSDKYMHAMWKFKLTLMKKNSKTDAYKDLHLSNLFQNFYCYDLWCHVSVCLHLHANATHSLSLSLSPSLSLSVSLSLSLSLSLLPDSLFLFVLDLRAGSVFYFQEVWGLGSHSWMIVRL